jgi:hypothetical protein
MNTPAPSPAPSTFPQPITISASPDPTVVGLGAASGSYPSNVVAASLDLEGFTAASGQYYNTVSVYLSDTYVGPTFTLTGSTACASQSYLSGLTSVQQVGTGNGFAYYRFSFLDELPAGAVYSDACTITLVDGVGSQAVLEVYQNQNTITVDKKARKKR